MTLAQTMLAWRPFLDPVNGFYDYWWVLIIPLTLFVSVIYKAMRIGDLRRLPVESVMLSLQIMLGMLGLGLVIHIIAEVATHTGI
ncbi:MAG TPA: hypothetical protein ENJ06_04785 [Phycisphaeraceae bacterium]|nr:hypothetical protein [Phycisphaeraceae bacterium]